MDFPAGLLALVFADSAAGDRPSLQRIADALNHLGWRHSDRTPVSERHQISEMAAALAHDAVTDPRKGW